MGPPKNTSPPLNKIMTLLNEADGDEDDDIDTNTMQSALFEPQIVENLPTTGRKERVVKILQNSSLPLISPSFDEIRRTLSGTTNLKRQNESDHNSPIRLHEDDASYAENDLINDVNEPSSSLSNKFKLLDGSKSPNYSQSHNTFEDKHSENRTNIEAIRLRLAIPNHSWSHSTLYKNKQINDASRFKEENDTANPIHQAKGIANLHIPKYEKSDGRNSEISTIQTNESQNSFDTIEKEITPQSSVPHPRDLENISLQSSSIQSKIEKPLVPQISDTKTIYSSYIEDRDEHCFFDRAKFIAICGEDFFDQSQEPWPQDVKLYQPYEVEQVILPDNANCLAVQAYLKMCGLDFQTEQRHNAEYMSPSGRVPFIKCGAFVVSELDPIIAFINTKGISLTGQLDAGQRADMRAYMSLANTVLANAELYVAWVDATTANAVTRPRYGSVHPWPLNHIVTWQKSRQVRKRLAVLGWLQKSLQEVYMEVETCCNALSERLDKKEFFFGTRPTELDALVFGHLFTVLTTPLPSNQLASIVRGYPTLIELIKRIEREFFRRDD